MSMQLQSDAELSVPVFPFFSFVFNASILVLMPTFKASVLFPGLRSHFGCVLFTIVYFLTHLHPTRVIYQVLYMMWHQTESMCVLYVAVRVSQQNKIKTASLPSVWRLFTLFLIDITTKPGYHIKLLWYFNELSREFSAMYFHSLQFCH